MFVKLIHNSNIKWFTMTLYFREAYYCAKTHQPGEIQCNLCSPLLMVYSAVQQCNGGGTFV